MKKVFLAIAAVVLSATTAMAQSEAGSVYIKPMVGGTLTTLTKLDDTKMKLGLVGGAEFGYQISDEFAVTAGVLASMQGAKSKKLTFTDNGASVTGDGKYNMTYLNIPIMANYYVAPGLAIKAGIQPGFLLKNKLTATYRSGGVEVDFERSSTDGMAKVDFSIPLGISYEISDFVIDARYNLGLTSIYKKETSDFFGVKPKNSVIMLTVGYKIPLN
jgi:hypothetical protein